MTANGGTGMVFLHFITLLSLPSSSKLVHFASTVVLRVIYIGCLKFSSIKIFRENESNYNMSPNFGISGVRSTEVPKTKIVSGAPWCSEFALRRQ